MWNGEKKGAIMIRLFFLLLFCMSTLFADTVFVPKHTYDYSDIPPFAANLSRNERVKHEKKRDKEIEHIVKSVVDLNDDELDKKADELSKDKEKLKRFFSNMPTSVVANKAITISPQMQRILYKQYDYKALKKKITLSLKSADIKDVIALIGKNIGLSFVVAQDVAGTIGSLHLQNISAAGALRSVLASNKPQLALLHEEGVWRIMLLEDAKQYLSMHEFELEENDFTETLVTLANIQFSETQKMQIEKMWQGITGKEFTKSGTYLIFDEQSKKVFFRGRKAQVLQMKKYLTEIDERRPQVKIEARYVCAEKGFEENIGFQWSGIYNRRASVNSGWNFIGAGKPLSDISNTPGEQTQASLIDWALNFLPTPDKIAQNLRIPFIFGGNDLNTKRLNLVLNAAENRNEIKTILNPTVLTNDQESAEILVGENLPIETIVEESVEGRLRNVKTANYKDIGIQLKVKPIVMPDKSAVLLEIFVENSQESETVTPSQTAYPVIRTTRARTKVLLKNGETTMISGLLKDIKENYKTKAPLISDIPVVGWFFKGSRKVATDMQLLIFITPTIV